MELTVQVYQKGNEYVAKCKELSVFAVGSTSEQAVSRLRTVIRFYVDSVTVIGEPEQQDIHDYFNNPNWEVLN